MEKYSANIGKYTEIYVHDLNSLAIFIVSSELGKQRG